ncbi:MAG TPA: hypothetical protein VLJ15_06820 [Gammaproteobacteria bacterium]|nr:hypothetical protein [Gammaproteobacteria bacterium]
MKKIILLITQWMMLLLALIFSVNALAQDPTLEDVDSAYRYFSQESGVSSPETTDQASPASPVETPGGFGGVATNLLLPVHVVSSFLYGMSIVIGLVCLFAAFVRYLQYRVNPLANPISTVVTLLILGILLLVLPLVYKLTESGVPFSLSYRSAKNHINWQNRQKL